MEFLADPPSWIETGAVPVIYVAHPVAPQPGEVLVRCAKCNQERQYGRRDIVDLSAVCGHDVPVFTTSDRDEIVAANLRRAIRWWKWLQGYARAVWIMPWYVNVTANGEGDPDAIARGLFDDCTVVARCDALMLCGPRVSSGMRREADAAVAASVPVFHVDGVATEPPTRRTGLPWMKWRPELKEQAR